MQMAKRAGDKGLQIGRAEMVLKERQYRKEAERKREAKMAGEASTKRNKKEQSNDVIKDNKKSRA